MQYWMKNPGSAQSPYIQDDWKAQLGPLVADGELRAHQTYDRSPRGSDVLACDRVGGVAWGTGGSSRWGR
jgi:hypothetical protein